MKWSPQHILSGHSFFEQPEWPAFPGSAIGHRFTLRPRGEIMEVPEVTPSIFDALPCFRDGYNLRLDDGGWATKPSGCDKLRCHLD